MAARVAAQNIQPGDRIRWMGRVLHVERTRVEPLSSAVSLFADGERITVGWGDLVEIVEAEDNRV